MLCIFNNEKNRKIFFMLLKLDYNKLKVCLNIMSYLINNIVMMKSKIIFILE